MRVPAFSFILLVASSTLLGQTAFPQIGIYGPVSVHIKAGDPVPDLTFTKILSAGAGVTSWSSVDFTGKFTVLAFFPDTSHNFQSVSRWNAIVDQFAQKPVQFGWITGEKETTLLPWIQQHPIKGLVFYDPDGATGRAFGMEHPAGVIVGPDRNIVGFQNILVEAQTIIAALEGRITTTPVQSDPASLRAFVNNGKVPMDAEPFRFRRPAEYKPDFPPSYVVHISPSGAVESGNFGGDDFRSLRAYSLKRLVIEIYGVTAPRILFPPALDPRKLYDVALVLPEREDTQQMDTRIQHGIEDYFHISATHEERLLDVYVVTSVNGKPPAAENDHEMESLGGASSSFFMTSRDPQGSNPVGDFDREPAPSALAQVRGVSTDGTADWFCRNLESFLDRPVVNETHLQGHYKFDVKASDGPGNDFVDRLRDQLHLSITPDQRRIDVLVFNPR